MFFELRKKKKEHGGDTIKNEIKKSLSWKIERFNKKEIHFR